MSVDLACASQWPIPSQSRLGVGVRHLLCSLFAIIVFASRANAYTASKIWFEFRADGRFRVHVVYTVPELQEVRESYVDFKQKAEAEKFYWDLVRGADFFSPEAKALRFINPPLKPQPW